MARLAKAGRQEPVVGLVDRGVSVAGGAAQEGLTAAKRACPEMAWPRQPQTPGSGAGSDINVVPNIPSRRTAAATRDMRGGQASATPPRVARKWRRKSLK